MARTRVPELIADALRPAQGSAASQATTPAADEKSATLGTAR
jgi:hypothetical protein